MNCSGQCNICKIECILRSSEYDPGADLPLLDATTDKILDDLLTGEYTLDRICDGRF